MKKKSFISLATISALFLAISVPSTGNTALPYGKIFCEEDVEITIHTPFLQFNNIWAEHNVYENNRKGMRIHISLNINKMKGKTCRAVAYFYHENGSPVRDRGGSYHTSNGNVSSGKDFTPGYDNCSYNDLTLFLPYGELGLDGTFRLKYRVAVFYHELQIGAPSNWEVFNMTWRRNSSSTGGRKSGC